MSELQPAAQYIHQHWHEAVVRRDVEALIRLYAEDAVFESPLVLLAWPDRASAIVRGQAQLRSYFQAALPQLPGLLSRWYRTDTYFTDGRQLVWEYPRCTPEGDQTDIVEVMDMADRRIAHHRVYFGWVGVKALLGALHPGAS